MTAKEILESQVWKDTVTQMRGDLMGEFERVSPDDDDELRNVSYKLWALNSVLWSLQRGLEKTINLKGK